MLEPRLEAPAPPVVPVLVPWEEAVEARREAEMADPRVVLVWDTLLPAV